MKHLITSLWFISVINIFFINSVKAQTYAEVLESKVLLTIRNTHSAKWVSYEKIKVYDEKGYDHSLFYAAEDNFHKVKNFEVTIYDAQGNRVKKANTHDLIKFSPSRSYELDDVMINHYNPNYKIYPFTAEISYEIEFIGYLNFPNWVPQKDYNLAVRQAAFDLTIPNQLDIRYLELNGMIPAIEVKHKNSTLFQWLLFDMPPLTRDLYSLPLSQTQPKLIISPSDFSLGGHTGSLKEWKSFGDWFYELNKDRNELLPETKAYLEKEVKNLEDTVTKVKKVYKYMQDRTRYISIQLGMGGFQTIPSDEVDKLGYGDCKALSNYTVAMLNQLGIKAHFVLINAGEDKVMIAKDFPSNQFNHVIVSVPLENDTLWLECTSQSMPFNYLGKFTDDRYGLWIEDGGSKIVKTPTYSHEDTHFHHNAKVVINDHGGATIDLSTTKKGAFYSDAMIYNHLDDENTENHLYDQFKIKDYTIKNFEHSFDKERIEFNGKYNIQANALANISSDRLIFNPNIFSVIDKIPLSTSGESAYQVERGYTFSDEIKFDVPGDFKVTYYPQVEKLDSKFGIYSMEISLDGNTVIYKRKLKVYKGIYTGEDFLEFKKFVNNVYQFDKQKVLYKSKT